MYKNALRFRHFYKIISIFSIKGFLDFFYIQKVSKIGGQVGVDIGVASGVGGRMQNVGEHV